MTELMPIPEFTPIEGWKQVAIAECGQPLIPASLLDPKRITVSPEYWNQGIPNAVNDCYVREEVGHKLVKASYNLPTGYKLLLWDAWRPVEVQQYLFNHFRDKLRASHDPISEQELFELTQQYVSVPSIDITKPSPHITGGSVDLTIVNADGEQLDMGTEFDDFSERANTCYFENNEENPQARNNRRLLYAIMRESGFSNYSCEWWHFDYGNQFWGQMSSIKQAKYGIICL